MGAVAVAAAVTVDVCGSLRADELRDNDVKV